MARSRNDDGGVLAGLLVVIVVGIVAYGGYWGYQYWDENQDTTPAAASVPPGGEKLSGKGVTLVIPRGWSQDKVSDKELERRYEEFVAVDPDAADKAGVDQVVDPAASVAFLAIEDKQSKGREDLNVTVAEPGDTDLTSLQSALNVLLERSGARRLKWKSMQLGGVDARQVSFQRKIGDATLYQRQYFVIGDNVAATLNFSSLEPIDVAEADRIADTIRVD